MPHLGLLAAGLGALVWGVIQAARGRAAVTYTRTLVGWPARCLGLLWVACGLATGALGVLIPRAAGEAELAPGVPPAQQALLACICVLGALAAIALVTLALLAFAPARKWLEVRREGPSLWRRTPPAL